VKDTSASLPWEIEAGFAKDDGFGLFDDFNELALQVGVCFVPSVLLSCVLSVFLSRCILACLRGCREE
jgi:hypothetical protein